MTDEHELTLFGADKPRSWGGRMVSTRLHRVSPPLEALADDVLMARNIPARNIHENESYVVFGPKQFAQGSWIKWSPMPDLEVVCLGMLLVAGDSLGPPVAFMANRKLSRCFPIDEGRQRSLNLTNECLTYDVGIEPRSGNIESYLRHLARLQQTEQSLQSLALEKIVRESADRRELMGALMSEDWLGMELLFCLADCTLGKTITELADRLQRPVDLLACVLAQLAKRNAVDVQNGVFICTKEGNTLVEQTKALTHLESARNLESKGEKIMSFIAKAKELMDEMVDQVQLNILVWGAGKSGGPSYKKRVDLRKRLKEHFKKADVKFSEEISKDPALKETPLASRDLLFHQRELWHLAACDVCVVLDTSKGSGEEIAHFSASLAAHKMLIFTNETYKDVESFPASLRRYGNQRFYRQDEFDSCNLIGRILTLVRHVALAKLLQTTSN